MGRGKPEALAPEPATGRDLGSFFLTIVRFYVKLYMVSAGRPIGSGESQSHKRAISIRPGVVEDALGHPAVPCRENRGELRMRRPLVSYHSSILAAGLPNRRRVPWLAAAVLAVCMVLAALCGCSKKAKVVEPELPITAEPGVPQWTFGSNGIRLRFQATAMLNSYESNPHTLSVCVYQFSDPNAFNDMCKTKDGLVKLLKCENFGGGVAGVTRIILQPGELRNIMMDRAEGAKFVAVVGGFYDLKPEGASLLFEIPITVFKKGFIFKKKYQVPGQFEVKISLGANAISEVKKK